MKAGQYEQSIKGFSRYLQQYPNGQYADNAQFWVGEAYYVMRKFEPAITQYQKLISNYPDSQKQAHALLKIAYSFDELGRSDQAVKLLTHETEIPRLLGRAPRRRTPAAHSRQGA